MSDDLAQLFVHKMFGNRPDSPVVVLLNAIESPAEKKRVLGALVRDVADPTRTRRLAVDRLRGSELGERYRRSLLLGAAQAIEQFALQGERTPDQEQLVRQLLEDAYSAAFRKGILDQEAFLQLALAWKGVTNFTGWDGLQARLAGQPQLRGPLAYVLAHRYRRLNMPDEAARLLAVARQDAPANSTLARLAQAVAAAGAASATRSPEGIPDVRGTRPLPPFRRRLTPQVSRRAAKRVCPACGSSLPRNWRRPKPGAPPTANADWGSSSCSRKSARGPSARYSVHGMSPSNGRWPSRCPTPVPSARPSTEIVSSASGEVWPSSADPGNCAGVRGRRGAGPNLPGVRVCRGHDPGRSLDGGSGRSAGVPTGLRPWPIAAVRPRAQGGAPVT